MGGEIFGSVKIKRTPDGISFLMSGAEGRVLLEELLDVPGGSRMPKISQLCRGLGLWAKLEEERVEELRTTTLYSRKRKKP